MFITVVGTFEKVLSSTVIVSSLLFENIMITSKCLTLAVSDMRRLNTGCFKSYYPSFLPSLVNVFIYSLRSGIVNIYPQLLFILK